MRRVPLRVDKLLDQALVARRPADGQALPQLLLDRVHLFVDLAARKALDGPDGDGVHRRDFEEPDGLLHVVGLNGRL